MNRAASAWSVAQLRELAKARLPKPVFDFYDGGAEDEVSLRANVAAFDQVPLVPRSFVDVTKVDAGCTLLGAPAKLPLAIAPMGGIAYGWRDGDVALARAAAAAGVPYTLSTMAATGIEGLAARAGGRLWFQAHLLQPRERTLELVRRAEQAGYEALMVTADLPVGGKRERDLRNGLSMPFRLRLRHVPAFAVRPRWSLEMLVRGTPQPANVAPPARGAASSIGGNFDPAFDWDQLAAMRARWPRKFIVKGILHPEDAKRAAALGVDAIVVSNHGGRQLDGAIAPMRALPAIVDAVQGRAQVLVDGGITRGRQILQALQCGAGGVLLGRAVLWGVCAGGEVGAGRALALLADELATAMRLCGVTQLRSLGPPFRRD